MKRVLFIGVVVCLAAILSHAAGNKRTASLSPQVPGEVTRMKINKVDIPLRNDGAVFEGDGAPGYYPSGQTTLGFLFSGGFGICGYVNGQLRASWMATASLLEEWLPGKWGMDPIDPLARFYEVSVNDAPGSQAYIDWADAVSLGADFIDLNGDGVYNPYTDKPALMGDKTIWTVFNDSTVNAYPGGLGTQPMGLEIQQTAWAYQRGTFLQDGIFFWHRLINTTSDPIDSLIYTVWEDPDIGDYTDDLIGCDTTLNLGYCYNDGTDNNYGINPPAFGIKLLQGPLAGSPGDTAYVFRGIGKGIDTLVGMKNLPMTSFMYYIQGGAILHDPRDAQTARYYQEGGKDAEGYSIDPTQWGSGGTSTTNPKFFYSGDPVTFAGWVDNAPADKRFMVNYGPFDLAAGDTLEIVFAYTVGRGSNALNSITVLRQRAAYLDDFFPAGRLLDIIANDTLISTDSIFVFDPLLSNLAFNDTIQSVNWYLVDRPPGSSAQLTSGPGFQAILDPDLPGTYTVTAQATVSGGHLLTDSLTVRAVSNHPPVAQLTIDPSEMVFGQAAMADARGSFDPDGDALAYSWTLPNWVSGLFPDTGIVYFTPLHTGAGEAQVTVSDPFFADSASDNFKVKSDSTDLKTMFHSEELQNIIQMQLVNGKIFALSSSSEFYVFDSGITPGQIDTYFLGGARFVIEGNLMAKYGNTSSVSLYTIDTNSQPVYIGDISASVLQYSGRYFDLHFRSNRLFIPAAPRNLRVYDISDPYNPILLNSYELPLPPILNRDVVFDGDIAAFYNQLSSIGLVTLDLNTLAPLDSLTFGGQLFINLEMSSNKIYMLQVSTSESAIQIVDASQPNNLQVAGVITVEPVLPGMGFGNPVLEMEAVGDTLLLGLRDGILLYDVSDPYNPREIAGRRSGLEVLGMAWDGPLLYMAERGDTVFGAGYYVLGYDSTITGVRDNPRPEASPTDFELFQNYPNPFNPETVIRYHLPSASQVELAIYNILGQKVRTLVNSTLKPGAHKISWNGRNDAGVAVASGVYIYRLQADGYVKSRKMLLLR